PIPIPFHLDLEREGFDVPRVIFFYFVIPIKKVFDIKFQKEELFNFGWFDKGELKDLKTFDQVRSVASFAIDNYPNKNEKKIASLCSQ
ncbi:MAG: hypothetical protein AAB838_00990, partial [Patescibacteria group bacterium]